MPPTDLRDLLHRSSNLVMILVNRIERNDEQTARKSWNDLLWLNNLIAEATATEPADIEGMVRKGYSLFGQITERCSDLGLV
jgi:hypothetical protein